MILKKSSSFALGSGYPNCTAVTLSIIMFMITKQGSYEYQLVHDMVVRTFTSYLV